MVASQQKDVIREPLLESEQQKDYFWPITASVHVVSHEEIIGVGTLPSDPKQLHEVVELTVYIATHCHRTLHLGEIHGE